jgi:hypothetical protein
VSPHVGRRLAARTPGRTRTVARVIDTPIERLPYIDEHAVGVHATERETWDALLEVLPRSFDTAAVRRFGSLLGVEPAAAGGAAGTIGSTVPGFVCSRAVEPTVLALLGRHRFSRYALIFRIERTSGGTRLRAETRAEFPGTKGRAYRALVIGTRGHVLVVRRVLRAVKRRAERG